MARVWLDYLMAIGWGIVGAVSMACGLDQVRSPSAPCPQESESNDAVSALSRVLSPGDDSIPRPPAGRVEQRRLALKFLIRQARSLRS